MFAALAARSALRSLPHFGPVQIAAFAVLLLFSIVDFALATMPRHLQSLSDMGRHVPKLVRMMAR